MVIFRYSLYVLFALVRLVQGKPCMTRTFFARYRDTLTGQAEIDAYTKHFGKYLSKEAVRNLLSIASRLNQEITDGRIERKHAQPFVLDYVTRVRVAELASFFVRLGNNEHDAVYDACVIALADRNGYAHVARKVFDRIRLFTDLAFHHPSMA